MAVQKPELVHSPMTNSFYFVGRWKAPGVAGTKVDVSQEVENVVSHARGPLVDAMSDAIELIRRGDSEGAAVRLKDGLADNWMQGDAPAPATAPEL